MKKRLLNFYKLFILTVIGSLRAYYKKPLVDAVHQPTADLLDKERVTYLVFRTVYP